MRYSKDEFARKSSLPINPARTGIVPNGFSRRATTNQGQALRWFGFAVSKIPISATKQSHQPGFRSMGAVGSQPELTRQARDGVAVLLARYQKWFRR